MSNEFEGREILKDLKMVESRKNTEERFKDLISESRDFLLRQRRVSVLGKRQDNGLGRTQCLHLKLREESTKCLKISVLNSLLDNENTTKPSTSNTPNYFPATEPESKPFTTAYKSATIPVDTFNNSEDTIQAHEIFNDYIKNASNRGSGRKDLRGSVAVLTCLRYVEFEEMLKRLSAVSKRTRGKITKVDFICEITSLAKFNGFAVIPKAAALSSLYDLMHEKCEENMSLKDIAGGLSILCKGSSKEKIRLALQCMGVEEIAFSDLNKLLASIFKILLRQIPNSLRSENITASELSRMAALQCFEDCGKGVKGRLSVEEFVGWFSSQAKTLRLEYVLSNSPKAKLGAKNSVMGKPNTLIVYPLDNPINYVKHQSKLDLYKHKDLRIPFLLENQLVPCYSDTQELSTIGRNTSRRDSMEVNDQNSTRGFIDMIPHSICDSTLQLDYFDYNL
eukprot:TRINITY_DN15181_c0_g1_i2.p1 TRINITY_DN15181_c0_g1~~TRINITY_DN15181_c0_g1_i2.p1  ORF type:complete len:451 (+),score=83.56 TRINITY_DN15181_c0_g1_i2:131-1483(+)